MNQDLRNGDNISGDKVLGDKVAGDKVYGDKKVYHLSDKDAARNQRIRAHLLEQLQATWIEGVLENSLYEVARLELGLESQPDAVERPWVMELERPNHPPKTLPPTSKILDTYRELGGSVLILGAPGSGKTITLLELARDLRQVALKDDSQPVPLVFNLASWAQKRQPLLDWLAEELFTIYGVGRKHAPKWLETADYHLLLDGLDEVAASHREACVQIINHFRQEHGPVNLIVTSRTNDYNQLTTLLQFMSAIHIQPLNPAQINTYLTATNPYLTQLVNNDFTFQELAKTPLILNIIALAYQNHLPDEIIEQPSLGLHHHLFSNYTHRMFDRRPKGNRWNKQISIKFLSWLALQLQNHDQTIYHIEAMQPKWLEHQNKLYQFVNILIFGLIFGLISGLFGGILGGLSFGLIFGVDVGLKIGLIIGSFSGLIIGLIRGKTRKISLTETLEWHLKDGLRSGVISGVIIGFILSAILGVTASLRWDPSYFLYGVLLGGPGGLFFGGLIFGIIRGLQRKEVEIKVEPNQGIRLSGKNAIKVGLSVGLINSLILGMLGVVFGYIFGGGNDWLTFGLAGWIIGGSIGSVFGGMIYGGDAFIKHFILRWFLARNGYLPFKLITFLDNMAERLILRRVGGGYIFIHRMLLEYFADLAKEQDL